MDHGLNVIGKRPGPWLRPGRNEVVILDLLGPEKPLVAGLTQPILDQLRPELDFARDRRPGVRLALENHKPILEGRFPAGSELQEVQFSQPRTGRCFCIETVNPHDGMPFAAIAELSLLDPSGKPLCPEAGCGESRRADQGFPHLCR